MNKIISWVCSIFMLLSTRVFFPSIGSIIFLIGGLFALPINKWQAFLVKKTKLNKSVKPVLIAILFFVGVFTVTLDDSTSVTDELNQEATIITLAETVEIMTESVIQTVEDVVPEITVSQAIIENQIETVGFVEETITEELITTEAETVETIAEEIDSIEDVEETMIAMTETESVLGNSSFNVQFIDVGQADAALVECDGHYMLIDGGNKDDSSLMYSLLKKNAISHLDIVVGTHAHEDHIGGLPGAMNYATSDIVLSPVTAYDSEAFSDFKKYAELNGNGIVVPQIGSEYTLGSASVKILGLNASGDTNNTSIILKIQYGETSFLFTGDAERDAEQAVLNSGADLSSTVLKVGHHGSDTSTSYVFLREIMPEYAVVSVGSNNSYGHPTDNVLSRLQDADIKTYRTDLHGDICVTSDGKNISFAVEKNTDTETLIAPSLPVVHFRTEIVTKVEVETEDEIEGNVDDIIYVLNKNTKKFHNPSCSSVKDIKPKNYAEYIGISAEIEAMGYVGCKRCNPN